jgi:hypothetical protein
MVDWICGGGRGRVARVRKGALEFLGAKPLPRCLHLYSLFASSVSVFLWQQLSPGCLHWHGSCFNSSLPAFCLRYAVNMPQVISYTPPWLSRPSPGATLFSSPSAKDLGPSPSDRRETGYARPTRTLARRGNEVFAVVDNQIRWSSLSKLKDEWKQQSKAKRDLAMERTSAENKDDGRSQAHYKVGSQTAYPTRLTADRISS